MAKKKASLPVASTASPREYRPTKADIAREKRYQAESDIRTMQQASEIKADKERVSNMKNYAKEMAKAVSKC